MFQSAIPIKLRIIIIIIIIIEIYYDITSKFTYSGLVNNVNNADEFSFVGAVRDYGDTARLHKPLEGLQ